MKHITHIVSIYNTVKEHDVPDTFILRNVFPKHGIFISYRKWMNIKNMKHPQPKVNPNQILLFGQI